MNTCQHFKPDHSTAIDHHGQCQKIITYRERGGSAEKTEAIIRDKLNGALKTDTGRYLATECDGDKGCEFYSDFKK
jgi:hypothetical protein